MVIDTPGPSSTDAANSDFDIDQPGWWYSLCWNTGRKWILKYSLTPSDLEQARTKFSVSSIPLTIKPHLPQGIRSRGTWLNITPLQTWSHYPPHFWGTHMVRGQAGAASRKPERVGTTPLANRKRLQKTPHHSCTPSPTRPILAQARLQPRLPPEGLSMEEGAFVPKRKTRWLSDPSLPRIQGKTHAGSGTFHWPSSYICERIINNNKKTI